MHTPSDHLALDHAPALQGVPFLYEDPLDEDTPDDRAVSTTRRGLCRLAVTAAETGARFERERIGHDPAAWLLAPRVLFGGRAALDACLSREHYVRATLLHGLGLGLDADPSDVDDLLSDDDDDNLLRDNPGNLPPLTCRSNWSVPPKLSLFTATLAIEERGSTFNVVAASLAEDADQFVHRFATRVGPSLAGQAVIREGVDPTDPLIQALLSTSMTDMLSRLASQPNWPVGAGLDLHLEQRLLRLDS